MPLAKFLGGPLDGRAFKVPDGLPIWKFPNPDREVDEYTRVKMYDTLCYHHSSLMPLVDMVLERGV